MWIAIAVLVLLLVVTGIVLVLLKSKPKTEDEPEGSEVWPFKARPIMTKSELNVFNNLCAALPNHTIFVQVGLSRLVEAEGKNKQSWFNRIGKMSVDYVICEKNSLAVIAVLELDDHSHNSNAQKVRDEKKDKVLETAGIKIVRWHVSNIPNTQEIQKQFQ